MFVFRGAGHSAGSQSSYHFHIAGHISFIWFSYSWKSSFSPISIRASFAIHGRLFIGFRSMAESSTTHVVSACTSTLFDSDPKVMLLHKFAAAALFPASCILQMVYKGWMKTHCLAWAWVPKIASGNGSRPVMQRHMKTISKSCYQKYEIMGSFGARTWVPSPNMWK